VNGGGALRTGGAVQLIQIFLSIGGEIPAFLIKIGIPVGEMGSGGNGGRVQKIDRMWVASKRMILLELENLWRIRSIVSARHRHHANGLPAISSGHGMVIGFDGLDANAATVFMSRNCTLTPFTLPIYTACCVNGMPDAVLFVIVDADEGGGCGENDGWCFG